jgi:putative glutamine amidotransferase
VEGKPIIGINADYRSATKDKPAFSFLAAGYAEAVSKAGGIPVVLPPMEDPNDISQLLDTLHGVVLTGGADLDPRLDGFMMHPAVQTLERKRENFDRLLAKMILKRRMPVFGIGVGMQLLNVTQGGNLYLHIPEDMPDSLPHRDALDRAHRHGLEVARNSLMERVYGDGEIRVNSMHHMAIDELGSAFRVTARCPDGVIEAIESVDPEKWFAVGTQFHPEAESASALDLRIFEEFIWGVKGEVPEARMVA